LDKLRIGLIGYGKMMGAHIKAVNLLDTVEISAVCDVIEKNAREVAKVLTNNPKVYTDYHKILDDVDAVLIALPHDLHFECGMYFALHQKHILMEKPLCNSEEECIRLIETCDKMGVTLMCAYPVRFWRGVVKLKELIDSGEYGEIIQMSIWTEQLTGIGADYSSEIAPWSVTNRVGGGQFFSHGCHYIDVLLWFLGNPVQGAHLGTRNGTPWMLREGTSAAIIRFENGALAYHGATWGARGTRLGYDFQIQTEKGMLEYYHSGNEIRLYNKSNVHAPGAANESDIYEVIWKGNDAPGTYTKHEIQYFADCVNTGKEPMTSGKKALQSLRVIWKMYEAEKNSSIADLRGLGLDNAMP